MDQEMFFELLSRNGLETSEDQRAKLAQYAKLLIEWNQKVNLISRKDEENVLSRHVLHSLSLAMPQSMDSEFEEGSIVLDIGTGGGLPGVPLAIVRPDCTFRLVDSIQKKITAVSEMIAQLGLTNIQALAGRAEEMRKQKKLTPNFDGVVSRAVAPLDELVGWTKNLIKPGAFLYSLKGGDLSEEIARTKRMSVVAGVTSWPIELTDYDEFASEGKQIVKVTFR
ncbi:MAG TPA: 16S rRNA (guanine(527)-N(7))-methyltransferase RsmG [Candidatus Kapabacteria bacterium]|nr:16S rRNA (guanine(527)-N(7))-methyltransferase RsmG [Candidatus Kapabacteria bacterium]